jgi:SAM-dependent methyltransferase
VPHWSDSDSATIARLHRTGERALRMVPAGRVRAGLLLRWRVLLHRGDRVECPLCGWRFRHFMSAWNRPGAICWRCGAHERHRALWLLFNQDPGLLSDVRSMLHVSPEWCLERRLRERIGNGYVTSELEPGAADLTLDLRAADASDASFDAILCSHVLEHIEDDESAMRELHRMLEPGGWAIVMVPIDHARAQTLEDPAIRTPADRERAYLQHDHVRLYALDIVDRLAAAGFSVERITPALEYGPAAAARHGLLDTDDVLICRKAA